MEKLSITESCFIGQFRSNSDIMSKYAIRGVFDNIVAQCIRSYQSRDKIRNESVRFISTSRGVISLAK